VRLALWLIGLSDWARPWKVSKIAHFFSSPLATQAKDKTSVRQNHFMLFLSNFDLNRLFWKEKKSPVRVICNVKSTLASKDGNTSSCLQRQVNSCFQKDASTSSSLQ
jgi:hypothetical protein